MTMKTIILGSVVAVAAVFPIKANAISGTVCAAPTGPANGAVPTTGSFVKTVFIPKCSANVYLVADDQTSYFAVGSASSKGTRIFQGSTEGGGVTASGTCANTGCTSTDARTAAITVPAS